jgi:FtsP/CotA-like multicopper oxidase with cupredoxin domain
MVPATPGSNLPANWPQDGREGGVPDPTMVGPNFIQIGTEGGFLPMPTIVENQPIAWNLDPTTFNFGNVSDHALLLGPAERVDVIVDFSAYAGQTLILYNDAPAAFPALDARNDYYTGAPDLTEVGGVAGVLPGYGPNIRTIMQIKVEGTAAPAFDVAALNTAFAPVLDVATNQVLTPGVFARSQDPIIVGQSAYDTAYGMEFPKFFPNWGYARILDFSMRFMAPDGSFNTLPFETKAIQDEMGEAFDDYGRMSAKLGLELPNASANNAKFVLQGFNDPPTELIKLSKIGVPIGSLDDGTQIWKITHNGVDTHPIHFHLFHVQLINRVGWDNGIRLPDPNELGWKDTLRLSPLEDTIVALRPIAPRKETLPWPVPNSIRLLNPSLPPGSTLGFSNFDPLGNPITVTNVEANFGWEYVWHCHILSHEENDMMRAVAFAMPPDTPVVTYGPTGAGKKLTMVLNWTDSVLATGFTIQRASDIDFTQNLVTFEVGKVTNYNDQVGTLAGPFYYRVRAVNTVGSSVVGYSTITATSDWSNWVGPPQGLTILNVSQALVAKSPVVLNWTFTGTGDLSTMFGFLVERDTDPNFLSGRSTFFEVPGTTTTTFSDGSVKGLTTYYYRVAPLGDLGRGPWSNTAFITTIK